jgi:hypothetical protein
MGESGEIFLVSNFHGTKFINNDLYRKCGRGYHPAKDFKV